MVDIAPIAIVADGQDFFNAGVSAMLRENTGFSRVLQTRDYTGLTELLVANPQVAFLVIDLNLPGAVGLPTLRELHHRHPLMRIAVMSRSTSPREVLSVLAAGAQGFIPKQVGKPAELLCALKTVQEAGTFVPASLVEPQYWQHRHADEINPRALAVLTERQRQVITLLSEGHANKVIARHLGISPSTVKVHVHAAYRSLGVHSRHGAMAALRPTHRMSAGSSALMDARA